MTDGFEPKYFFKKQIFSVPVIMRWGREKHDDKDEDSDCESKIQTVAAGVSPAASASGFTNHYTVTVLQTKTKVFRVVFQSFITGIATIIIGGGTIVAHKMKVFIRFISRERGWGGLPVWSSIVRSSSGETRSCVRTKIFGISWQKYLAPGRVEDCSCLCETTLPLLTEISRDLTEPRSSRLFVRTRSFLLVKLLDSSSPSPRLSVLSSPSLTCSRVPRLFLRRALTLPLLADIVSADISLANLDAGPGTPEPP